MEQLVQSLKNGEMKIAEVPFPALGSKEILVRNHFSAVSAGTEGKTVKDARLGYIGKAKARQNEVKKVFEAARTHGFSDTYKMVMNKLDAPSALGYSTAGEVMAVGSDVKSFKVGDRVACAGASAVHAEVVAVPENLAVKVPDNVELSDAAFTTIAAIAMQGLRRANLTLGENCLVIGLGLIGQLTIRLLKASGIRCFGIDLDQSLVDLALNSGADKALNRNDSGLEEEIDRFSNGFGIDSVIITAATTSLDPVELAGRVSRSKGRVVVVGNVPTGFSRKEYYRKELDLLMSTSYGPGRYNSNFEEKGLDFPIAYVRWTEQRNMAAFVQLLSEGKVNMHDLISHKFPFVKAKEAYDMILAKTEPFRGILLEYDVQKQLKKTVDFNETKKLVKSDAVGFIGAGNFAQNFLLPNLKGKVNLYGISTSRPNSALNVASKFNFATSFSSGKELIENSDIKTVFITTRHNLHAPFVIEALNAGKRVYIEKPLCLNIDEFEKIKTVVKTATSDVMVGFNRRFSPHIKQVMSYFREGVPLSINYRINAGIVPADHWVHDLEIGGGRIIGEVCHFVDLASFIARSPVVAISAMNLLDASNKQDTLIINAQMKDGSIASINYFSNGSKKLNKEFLEIFSDGKIARIDDFKNIELIDEKLNKSSLSKQDKGHAEEMNLVAEALKSGAPFPVSIEETMNSTAATFAILESLQQNGALIKIELNEF